MRSLIAASYALFLGFGVFTAGASAQHCVIGSSSYQSYLHNCPADYYHHDDHAMAVEAPMEMNLAVDEAPALAEQANTKEHVHNPVTGSSDDETASLPAVSKAHQPERANPAKKQPESITVAESRIADISFFGLTALLDLPSPQE